MEAMQIEAKSITTQPSDSLPPNYRGIETSPALNAAFPIAIGFTIGFAIVSAVAASIYVRIPKQMQQRSFSFKPRHKVPCHRCQYFSSNPHLKCTVHPVTVLTEKAIDCADYRPNSETERVT
jgi:hypothetical protein